VPDREAGLMETTEELMLELWSVQLIDNTPEEATEIRKEIADIAKRLKDAVVQRTKNECLVAVAKRAYNVPFGRSNVFLEDAFDAIKTVGHSIGDKE